MSKFFSNFMGISRNPISSTVDNKLVSNTNTNLFFHCCILQVGCGDKEQENW